MLQSQDGGRDQHRHLLAVGYRFKCRTDGNFGLSKSNITADQAVHREGLLHIGFDIGCSLYLVGRIFINERSLQLSLQVSVRQKRKTFGTFPLGIELDELLCNVFDPVLGLDLQPVPCA